MYVSHILNKYVFEGTFFYIGALISIIIVLWLYFDVQGPCVPFGMNNMWYRETRQLVSNIKKIYILSNYGYPAIIQKP